MKTSLTIPEFEALLQFAFRAGQVSGKYGESSPGYRDDIGLKGYYPDFASWYKAEVDPAADPKPAPEKKKSKKHCPFCNSTKVIMFTADDDMCQKCGKNFPAV